MADHPKIIKLRIDEARQWSRQVLDADLGTVDGQVVSYLGEVLVAAEGPGHLLSFRCVPMASGLHELLIPICVTSEAIVQILIDETCVESITLTPSEKLQRVHYLKADITPWVKESDELNVRLRISYKRRLGSATIPLDGSKEIPGPTMLYRPQVGEAVARTVYFIMAWGSILAMAILMAAKMRALGETARFYSVLIAAGGWGASVLGFSSFAKIPVWGPLRKLYSLKTRRAMIMLILFPLFLWSVFEAKNVVYSLTVRYRYTQLIDKALSDPRECESFAAQAFAMLPWRREAQMIFDAYAYQVRTESNTAALRSTVKKFVENPGVKAAVDAAMAGSALPYALSGSDKRPNSDPLAWYASILPEASDDTDLNVKAIGLLKARGEAAKLAKREQTPDQVILQLESLSLQAGMDDTEMRQSLRKKLVEFITREENPPFITTFEYQVASDTIAISYLRDCLYSDATVWFERILRARRRTSYAEFPVWHRPPQKLILYHMFFLDESDEDLGRRTLDDDSRGCKSYRETFEAEIHRPNSEFHVRSAWLRQTTLGADLRTLAEKSLLAGWRY